jgi:serine/threonine-protein kinase
VADLVDTLRQHRLLKPVQLDEVTKSLRTRFPDPQALLKELVRRTWLTPFQAKQILHGATVVMGPYILLERLGEGGNGQVFKARHQTMDRVVALKVLRKELLTDSEAVGRFYREVEVISQVSHPAIVHAYDAGVFGSVHFLALEYVEGIDLDRRVKESGRLPVAQACEYIRQAALGLEHAHERGLVHRDIKPSNLLLASRDRERPEGVVKILDLGLARLQQPPKNSRTAGLTILAGQGVMQGTLDYLAPEQALDFHSADIRADIYSLGCTFYFLLTGQPPFGSGSVTQKLMRHQHAEAMPIERLRPGLPPGLPPILNKMLAKNPADRYQTPGEVAEAIAALGPIANEQTGDSTMSMDGVLTPARGVQAVTAVTGKWTRGSPRLILAGIGALLLLTCGTIASFFLSGFLVGSKPTEPAKQYVLVFNGTNNFITLPDDLFRQSPILTVEAWFKTIKGGVILSYQTTTYPTNPGSYVPVLYVGTDGILRGEFWNGHTSAIAGSTHINDDRWHHVALVADSSAKLQTLYLDGNSIGTRAGPLDHLTMHHNQIGIGYSAGWTGGNGGWFSFTGPIAEVRVWHVARTQAEIKQDMHQMLSGWEPGLAAYYPLDETTGDLAIDRSRHHRNAKLGAGQAAQQPTRSLVEPFFRPEVSDVNRSADPSGKNK